MPRIDPYTTIDDFREYRALERATKEAHANAVNRKNDEIVESGTALVEAGLDQWGLKDKVWETVERHVSLLRLAGINTSGRYELQKGGRKGDFEVKSNPVRMQTGLNAVIVLEAVGSLRGDRFHDVAEVDGIHSAMQQFAAPDVCYVYVYDQKSGQYVARNGFYPNGFNSFDPEFSEKWMKASSPFRLHSDFDCEAEKGRFQPTHTRAERPLTQQQIIYGAGLCAVHSAWLDEVEASM